MAAVGYASQATSSIGNAYNASKAQKAQGEYQRRVSEMNAQKTEFQAQGAEEQAIDAEKRGAAAVNKRAQEIRLKQGEQKAAMAAGGGDLNSEAANNIAAETSAIGEADMQAIKVNAWREAFGFKSQALAMRGEAINERISGETAARVAKYTARSTMISGITEAGQSGAKAYGAHQDNVRAKEAATKAKEAKGSK
jgi:seryl-tRNA synthetase